MSVEGRLQRLERSNRRLRTMLVLVVAVGAGVFMMGHAGAPAVSDVVTARAFHVVDKDGAVLVKLEDTFGSGRGVCGTVVTSDGKGNDLVRLGASPRGEGVLATLNGEGGPLVRLGATTDGEGVITTANGEGCSLIELGVARTGEGVITTQNAKGQRLVQLALTPDGEGAVLTHNPALEPPLLRDDEPVDAWRPHYRLEPTDPSRVMTKSELKPLER